MILSISSYNLHPLRFNVTAVSNGQFKNENAPLNSQDSSMRNYGSFSEEENDIVLFAKRFTL